MIDKDFEKALQAVFDEQCREIDNADIPQYEFSDKFERKMNRIIRKRKKPVMRTFNTFGKRAACIILCFLIASSVTVFSVDALRNKFLSLWVDEYEDHSDIKPTEYDESDPKYIEEIYTITYDLSDYEIEYSHYDTHSYNTIYRKGNAEIDFTQTVKESYNTAWNTEGSIIEKEIINGYEAIYFYNDSNPDYKLHALIWDNGDYMLSLTTYSTKEELLDIAKSVKKRETTIFFKVFVQFKGFIL